MGQCSSLKYHTLRFKDESNIVSYRYTLVHSNPVERPGMEDVHRRLLWNVAKKLERKGKEVSPGLYKLNLDSCENTCNATTETCHTLFDIKYDPDKHQLVVSIVCRNMSKRKIYKKAIKNTFMFLRLAEMGY